MTISGFQQSPSIFSPSSPEEGTSRDPSLRAGVEDSMRSSSLIDSSESSHRFLHTQDSIRVTHSTCARAMIATVLRKVHNDRAAEAQTTEQRLSEAALAAMSHSAPVVAILGNGQNSPDPDNLLPSEDEPNPFATNLAPIPARKQSHDCCCIMA